LGVAVLAASMLSARVDLRTITIKDAKPRTRLELIWRATSTASPAARVLVEQLRDAPILPVQQAAS
jgi:DNA-binding transcriptional LysR family regulator